MMFLVQGVGFEPSVNGEITRITPFLIVQFSVFSIVLDSFLTVQVMMSKVLDVSPDT